MSLLPLAVLLFVGNALATSNRIVGGEETSIEKYPYIVQLEGYSTFTGNWNQICGANILLKDWILSAAHCFEGWDYRPEYRRIRAGTTYRSEGGAVHYVDYEKKHPEYRKASRFDADINIVKLSTPLVWNPVIQRATIVSQGYELPDNAPVVHAGWGDTSFDGVASRVLRHVELYTINNILCRDRYKLLPGTNVVTPNMICAGLLDIGGRDACQGDSGGPLYAGEIVVGIVSWGHNCANATFPGISTKVSSYTDWIIRNAR
ncbi:trypsin, alkaline C-like [Pieris rapae]|uniref:trypsin, alkaline C-like n=1 Tax=Pieris rapae TaxID=64459 RepID=UPI001E27FEE2|nr:trypsin, alkaline C-like [Pieris rapae]